MGMVRMHPEVGYNILAPIEFPYPVAQIVAQHHERMDGSGYPAGLTGENILLEARILAVADVVEAMASHRPYRPAFDIEKALEEISRYRGTRYDEEVVGTCLKLFDEKLFVFEQAVSLSGPENRRPPLVHSRTAHGSRTDTRRSGSARSSSGSRCTTGRSS